MLQLLEIENYAVVERLRIGFHPGLNLLTGETGSGKSILVDAFSLLLGGKASAELIRSGADRARVAGVFELSSPPAGLELEQGELLVEREILANGKSRAIVNGRVTTLAALRELAPWLGNLHGQHEQQDLFSPLTQLEMLDQFCATSEVRERLTALFNAWGEASRRRDELRRGEQEQLRLMDLWRFQSQEIAQAAPRPGEDQRLEEEKCLLANLARIQQAGAGAYQALYDAPASAAAQLKAAARSLEDLARFAPWFDQLAKTLHGARLTLEEAARELRNYLDRLEQDPQRLAEIEDRLALIEKLKRKYGATIEQALAFADQVDRQIAAVESRDETLRRMEQELEKLAADYQGLAETLSQRRREGARRLEKPLEKELAALAMPRTRFVIEWEAPRAGAGSWTAQGVDRIRFLVSPNPGEPPRPLAMVASGGELSRITLALKTCLAGAPPAARAAPPTLVFDEIDAGIGGRAAESVGRRLHGLARHYQLLCVTHLPQIAGFADHHYRVDKQVKAGRTLATISELDPEERVQEMARMLSGAQVTADALRHAQQLLQIARSAARDD